MVRFFFWCGIPFILRFFSGGLLAKHLLLDDEELRKKTVGILFFATPHRGSPIARYSPLAIRPAHDVIMLRYKNLINKKV